MCYSAAQLQTFVAPHSALMLMPLQNTVTMNNRSYHEQPYIATKTQTMKS